MKLSSRLAAWLERCWYEQPPMPYLLPLSRLYQTLADWKRRGYQRGWLTCTRLPVPVIVVGNLSVGGTGKTPLTIWLVEWARTVGYRPGVVSRGYGGKAKHWPQRVTTDSDPLLVGDEPLLIARSAACPVAVAPQRAAAAALLLAEGCDLIIADDGLQHYALARDIEIAVVDGTRRYGNGACLPAGPLREPLSRLASVELLVCNGQPAANEFAMTLQGDTAINLLDGRRQLLTDFVGPVHALAGIGHPRRFFEQLRRAGLNIEEHPMPDHHRFCADDLEFNDAHPVLMTAKDAVKCSALADSRHWYLPVRAQLEPAFETRLLQLLQEKTHGLKTA